MTFKKRLEELSGRRRHRKNRLTEKEIRGYWLSRHKPPVTEMEKRKYEYEIKEMLIINDFPDEILFKGRKP